MNALTQDEFNNILSFLLKRNETIDRKPVYGFNPHKEQHAISMHFPELRFINSDSVCDTGFVWGNCINSANIRVLRALLETESRLVLCEDGFIRSYDTWCNTKAESRCLKSCSTVFDTHAYYFDSTRQSDIESMLNDSSLKLTDEQLAYARKMIGKIVSHKISKYNHQPVFEPDVGRPGRKKVLVIDQSYGDFSVSLGGANDDTFRDMLAAAVTENPGCDVLVKTHPDTMTGNRSGYYVGIEEREGLYKVTFPVNPYSLLEIVDKVYVCSTQFGMEALIAGKETHVFGLPFYSNWGVTVDAKRLERRTNRRSVEEIFYIFYCMYTKWSNPDTGLPCTMEEAVDWMISLRNEMRLG